MSFYTSQFLINTSHYVGGNKYEMKFSAGRSLVLDSESQIALSSISCYNSTFNIRSDWQNNKIIIFSNQFNLAANSLVSYSKGNSYTDPISGNVIAQKYIQFTIPDGYYDINSLELYFQNQFQNIGLYFASVNSESNYYFMECLTMPQRYKTSINLFPIPTALPSGFAMASNSCFTLPVAQSTLRLYFPSTTPYYEGIYGNLGRIFGFNARVILPLDGVTNVESINLSQICPRVSPISTYIVCCNLVQNNLVIPDNLLQQINLGSSLYGGIVPYTAFPQFVSCQSQNTSSIVVTLFDEYLQELQINDPQFSMVLSIKQRID